MILFGILILVASITLGFIVLVQNPKGGGLSGILGGYSNQLVGVRQSTDIMEKGTWIFAAIVGILCIMSTVFIPSDSNSTKGLINEISTKPVSTPAAAPKNSTQLPGTPAPTVPNPAP